MDVDALYYGENLDVLRAFPSACVDLVYLDPPFNSSRLYNVLFRDDRGHYSTAQEDAFADTWTWGMPAERSFAFLTNSSLHRGTVPDSVSRLVGGLRSTLGEDGLLAYLVDLAERLVELRRVLKPTGSLYLHCDPTASHYLKLVLDALFGREQFVNEIVWKRSSAHSDSRQGSRHFGRVSDTILFYSKSPERTFHQLYAPYDPEYVARDYRRVDEQGRRYRIDNLQGPGGAAKGNPYYELLGVSRYWRYSKERMEELCRQGRIVQTRPGAVPQYKRYLDEMPGMPVQNVWTDIPVLNNRSKEFLGFATQKPVALLERIIQTSSNPGDVVLDPYCGCGTALVAAQKLGRRWVGIDVTYLAILIMEKRLRESFGLTEIRIVNRPTEVEGARRLAQTSDGRYDFQWWALDLVDAWPVGGQRRKGADRGIDGMITFSEERGGGLGTVLVSVKSGHVDSAMIRDLRGTLEREKAALALFITLEEPTPQMRREAAAAGLYRTELGTRDYARIQILSVRELLEEGRRPQLPPLSVPGIRGTPRSPRIATQPNLFQLAPADQPESPAAQQPAPHRRKALAR